MSKRLGKPDLLGGTTTADQRRELVRRAILDLGLDHQIAGGEGRKRPETWGALFARVYKQPLNKQTVAA